MKLKSSLISAFTQIGVLRATFGIRLSAIWTAFDIRPVFFFGGLAVTGYGLYLQFSLGISLIFGGVVLMAVGYLMRGKP